MTREEALCKDCEYFKIVSEPFGYELGQAVCKKYDLTIDFRNHRKFKTLSCNDRPQELEQIKEKVEQEPKTDVLDKIRAEIETEIGTKQWEDYDYCSGLIKAKRIVDKYREQEPKTEQKIREELNRLSTYRVPNSKTDLVSRNAVERVLNLVFRGHRDKEPKRGNWIYTGDYITDGMLKCSQCGFEHDVSERFLYCPNCGCRMSEVSE